jgi:hypothetical protein
MSLKAFHLFFLFVSVLLCAGCSWWALSTGASEGFGYGSAALGAFLLIYGIYFVRKSSRIIT